MESDDDKGFALLASSNSTRSYIRLARELIPQWLLVAVLCAATAGALVGYETDFALGVNQQHAFYSVILGLTIFLALAVESLLARIAGRWKWLFLSFRKYNPQEVSLIMACESRWALVKLLFYEIRLSLSKRAMDWKIPLVCFSWLALGVAAQIGLACLGIAYSIAYPQDFGSFHAKTTLASSFVANLSAISPQTFLTDSLLRYDPSPSTQEQREAAHIYGLESSNLLSARGVNLATLTPDVVGHLRFFQPSKTQPPISWYYNMSNQAMLFNPNQVVISPRQIQVSSLCETLDIRKQSIGNGVASIEYQDRRYHQTRLANLTILHSKQTSGATTYAASDEEYWGPRSTRVLVITERSSSFNLVSCNVTVSPVSMGDLQPFEGGGHEDYGNQPFLSLPDEQARIFAGSIAWNPAQRIGHIHSRTFYRTSSWAVTGTRRTSNNPYYLGFSYAARFAMGAIASYDQNARTALASGVRSFTESYLVGVKWRYAGPILGLVPGILLLLILLSLWVLRDTPLRDDGAFVNAVVLNHLLPDELGHKTGLHHGRSFGERDIVNLIKKDVDFANPY